MKLLYTKNFRKTILYVAGGLVLEISWKSFGEKKNSITKSWALESARPT